MSLVRNRVLRALLASKLLIAAGVTALLVITGLSVQSIVSVGDDVLPPFDPAGKARSVALDGVDPTDVPHAEKGVKLGKPDSARERSVRRHLPTKSSVECGEAGKAQEVLGIRKGSKVCSATATRQSREALKANPL